MNLNDAIESEENGCLSLEAVEAIAEKWTQKEIPLNGRYHRAALKVGGAGLSIKHFITDSALDETKEGAYCISISSKKVNKKRRWFFHIISAFRVSSIKESQLLRTFSTDILTTLHYSRYESCLDAAQIFAEILDGNKDRDKKDISYEAYLENEAVNHSRLWCIKKTKNESDQFSNKQIRMK